MPSQTPLVERLRYHGKNDTLNAVVENKKLPLELREAVEAAQGACMEAAAALTAAQASLEEAKKDGVILDEIKKILHCNYDVVEISLAETEWERGYEACHRVIERTIRAHDPRRREEK